MTRQNGKRSRKIPASVRAGGGQCEHTCPVTDSPEDAERLRARQERTEAARRLQQIPDEELIDNAPGPQDDRYPMEMMRRLTTELKAFKISSDSLARRIITLNIILVVLTIVLVILTVRLVVGAS